MCLKGLSIEDMEYLFLFRTIITGFLLIRAGLVLAYLILKKVVTAVQNPTRLAAMIKVMEGLVGRLDQHNVMLQDRMLLSTLANSHPIYPPLLLVLCFQVMM